MFDFLKEKVAGKLIESKLKNKNLKPHPFTDFFSRSYTFFIAMPEDDHDFTHSLIVLNFLADNKKSAMILTKDYKVSLLPQRFRGRAVGFNFRDITKLNLPSKELIYKLSEMQFNVSIDLNRKENLFCSYSANLVEAPLRIGFAKADADKFYNFQIINRQEDSEISYKNFLNCLQMFQGST
jgi:hypothetical protein